MISKKMQDALNNQLRAEFYSGYLYLSMSACADALGYEGVANWLKIQSLEEFSHADKFFSYISERGGRVLLGQINEPPQEWDNIPAIFDAVLEHEQKVTGMINDLFDVAIEEKDHAAKIFLQWFIEEQVEEEDTVGAIINKIKLAGNHAGSMLMMDKEFGQRVFTPPAE